MKKNKMMRLASILLVLTLLSTSVISGTFAKYTTSAESQDTARVAKWGFNDAASISINNLFQNAYDNVGSSVDVIAPGTENSASFQFTYDESQVSAPEVAYTFTVSTLGSNCDQSIQSNPNIQWALYKDGTGKDDITWGTWNQLIYNIECMDGSGAGAGCNYLPGHLPAKFTGADEKYVVAWRWQFETADDNETDDVDEMVVQDEVDTEMGNASDLADVVIKITITATQID